MEQLSTRTSGWEKRLEALLSRSRAVEPEIEQGVADIIAQVRTQGDLAVLALTRRYDRFDPEREGLCIDEAAIASSVQRRRSALGTSVVMAYPKSAFTTTASARNSPWSVRTPTAIKAWRALVFRFG